MSVGRGVFWKKNTVDDAYRLDMARLAKDVDFDTAAHGYTTWNKGETSIGWEVCPPYRLRLHYTVTKRDGERTDYDYYVDLDTTPCHFGGKRSWFLCPNTTCGRRCRILYLAPGSPYFACRICLNLTYRSQQEGKSRAWYLGAALFDYPRLIEELWQTRSKRKRRRLLKNIALIESGVPAALVSLNRKSKKKKRKRKKR